MLRNVLLAAVIGGALMAPSAMGKLTMIAPPLPPDDGIVRPEPPPGYFYRWVPPVYRTVYDRVWVDGNCRWELQWVEVAPGQWEKRWVEVTQPGHWETTTRRLLLSGGYWELVRIEPPPPFDPPRPMPYPSVNPPTVGVDGYSRTAGEDLSKYSPLYEWPDKK